VPSRAGTLRAPPDLFDPHSKDLAALFDGARFPAAPFDSGPLLAALAGLGLRKDVDLKARPGGGAGWGGWGGCRGQGGWAWGIVRGGNIDTSADY
jgi:hypothetical protein